MCESCDLAAPSFLTGPWALWPTRERWAGSVVHGPSQGSPWGVGRPPPALSTSLLGNSQRSPGPISPPQCCCTRAQRKHQQVQGESSQKRGSPASPAHCPAARLDAPSEVTAVAVPRSRRAARLAGRTGWGAADTHPLGLHKHRRCWQRGSPSPHTKLPVRKMHGHPSESGPPSHRAGDLGGRRSAFGLHSAH